MRLIDADELYKKALDIIKDEASYKAFAIVNAISTAPTIEAEPVRHGKWERPTNSKIARYCSLCGTRHILGSANNFCHNCGAKIDGGEDG